MKFAPQDAPVERSARRVGARRWAGAFAAILLVHGHAPAQETRVVAPAAADGAELPVSNRIPFADGNVPRYQQAYSAVLLAPLAGGLIREVAFRLDQGSDIPPADFEYANVRLRLSSKPDLVDNLSANLDDNLGPDLLTVYDAPHVIGALDGSGAPKAFSFRFVLSTPFAYGGGDLLLEVEIQGQPAQVWELDTAFDVPDGVSRAWAPASFGPDSLGLATEFVGSVGTGQIMAMSDCGGNAGTLAHVAGAPRLGAAVTVAMDIGQAPGVVGFLPMSLSPIDGWPPCGLSIAGPGELLIDPSDPNPVALLGGAASWQGTPLDFTFAVPADLALVGVEVYQQGVWVDLHGLAPSEPVRLTGGLVLSIGLWSYPKPPGQDAPPPGREASLRESTLPF